MGLIGKGLAAGCVVALGAAAAAVFGLLDHMRDNQRLREELGGLRGEHEELRGAYNEAVRRTAVTELLVRDGALSVSVRTAAGEIAQIPTPFDPRQEIYVDFVVLDGRLWIRRVFDAATPPSEGVLIEPAVVEVNWDSAGSQVGKAVYRSLSEGRWLVTVTGDGSLGLARAEGSTNSDLESLPEVREFEPVP